MATYEEIYGKRVKDFDSDPTLDSSYEGQVWYNSATGALKSVVAFEAWTSATPMISAKSSGGSLPSNSSTYGLAGGGSTNNSWTGAVNNTFSWNGSGWASESNMNVARHGTRGDGTSTSALFVGGIRPPAATYSSEVESWNGSSWTAETAYPQAINQTSVAGIETAAVAAGGYDFVAAPSTGGRTRETFEYDGSSWTAQNNKPFGASNMGSAGTQTASIFFGGFGQPGDGTAPASPSSTPLSSAEEYDGTNWTTVTSLNTARYGLTGSGVQSDAGAIGGNPAITNFERWDGSSWTNSSTLGTGREESFAGGLPASTDGSFVGGGATPSVTSSTETFVNSINTITAAAWAAGGTVPYTSRQNMSFGTQTAAIACGGYVSTTLNTSVSYDGTSYSGTPNLNVAARMGGVAGTQAAGLEFGGIQPPGTYNANMQSWNGSSWSNSPFNLNSGSYGIMGCGTSTAALRAGGENPAGGAAWNLTEEYDGSSWTAGNTIPDGKYEGAGNGVQTSAVIAGGSPSGTSTYEYDGTNWTAGGALSTSRPGTKAGSAGVSSSSNIIFGGNAPPGVITATEGYDGTAWSTRPSLGTGRASTTGNGTATAGLMVSGGPPSGTSTATEEFTGVTETVTASTLTTS